MAAVVALGVTLGTGGAGGFAAGVATSLTLTGAQHAIMQAGVQAICAQTAVAFLSNDFDPVRAIASLGQKQAYTSILQSMATAGILDKIGLTTDPKSWLNHLNNSAINSGVNASLNMAIHGEKPEDALKQALISTVALTAGGVMASRIGEAYNDASPGMNYVTHKLAHGLLGAAVGGILSEGKAEGFIAGALGGVMSEMIAEEMLEDSKQVREDISRYEEENGIKLSKEDFQKEFHERMGTSTAIKAGKIGAAVVALLAEQNVALSIETATNAVENNFAMQVAQLGFVLWEAKEIIEIYFNEGRDAAIDRSMWVAGGMVTGAVALKYAGRAASLLGPKVKLILDACRKMSPEFNYAYTKVLSKTSQIIDKVQSVSALVDESARNLAYKYVTLNSFNKAFAPLAAGIVEETAFKKTLSKTGTQAAEKYAALVESKITGTYTANAITLADTKAVRPLLPEEGRVDTYLNLNKNFSKRADNLSAHHMPHDHYMKSKGISKNEGVSMMVEEPNPGRGGRHRDIHKVIKKQDPALPPRDALAQSINVAKQIYQKEGVYTSEINKSLLEVIKRNKEIHPKLFEK